MPVEPYRDNYYHDDPGQELFGKYSNGVRSLSKTLSALVIFVFSALFLQATLAANINLNSQKSLEFGQGFSAYTACSGSQSLLMQPKNNFDGSAFYLKSVSVSNIPSSCVGNDFSLSAYSGLSSPNGSIGFTNVGIPSPYLSATVTAPGTTSTTYEWWFYSTSSSPATRGMLQTRTNSLDGDGIDVSLQGNGITISNSTGFYLNSIGTYLANKWNHIALVRNGSTTWTCYLNGLSIGTFNFSGSTSTTLALGVKSFPALNYNEFFNGYISDFRYVIGTAVYTANFTPPTSMLSNISGTQLLLGTPYGAGYLSDSSGNNISMTSVSGSTTSVNQSPFPASSTPISIFNTSSTTAIIYDSSTAFVQGINSSGTTISTNSLSPTGSFTVTFDTPTALSSNIQTFTLQSAPHRTS
jgi:hypothetical protein